MDKTRIYIYKRSNPANELIVEVAAEDMRSTLGPMIAPIWKGISEIELKKLFLIPYLRMTKGLHLNTQQLVVTYDKVDIRKDINVVIVPVSSQEDSNLSSLLKSSEFQSVARYFATCTIKDFKGLSYDDFIRLGEPEERVTLAKLYNHIKE